LRRGTFNIDSDVLEQQQREIADKDREIERLRAALIVERDDAMT